jgi:hypothetical protein
MAAVTRAGADQCEFHHGLPLGLDEEKLGARGSSARKPFGWLFVNFNLMVAVAGQINIGFAYANAIARSWRLLLSSISRQCRISDEGKSDFARPCRRNATHVI